MSARDVVALAPGASTSTSCVGKKDWPRLDLVEAHWTMDSFALSLKRGDETTWEWFGSNTSADCRLGFFVQSGMVFNKGGVVRWW